METQTEKLWTVTRIADHLKITRHRVQYVINTRGIDPIDRAGISRVFDQDAVDLIANELKMIDANSPEVL